MAQTFEEISASDFFYRNRDIAGFTNPSRAIFVAIREIVENSLDAAESRKIPPDIFVRLSFEAEATADTQVYRLHVEDNGCGFEMDQVLSAENHPHGLGLIGMRERTELSDGIFSIESAKECGTTIRAVWLLDHLVRG